MQFGLVYYRNSVCFPIFFFISCLPILYDLSNCTVCCLCKTFFMSCSDGAVSTSVLAIPHPKNKCLTIGIFKVKIDLHWCGCSPTVYTLYGTAALHDNLLFYKFYLQCNFKQDKSLYKYSLPNIFLDRFFFNVKINLIKNLSPNINLKFLEKNLVYLSLS